MKKYLYYAISFIIVLLSLHQNCFSTAALYEDSKVIKLEKPIYIISNKEINLDDACLELASHEKPLTDTIIDNFDIAPPKKNKSTTTTPQPIHNICIGSFILVDDKGKMFSVELQKRNNEQRVFTSGINTSILDIKKNRAKQSNISEERTRYWNQYYFTYGVTDENSQTKDELKIEIYRHFIDLWKNSVALSEIEDAAYEKTDAFGLKYLKEPSDVFKDIVELADDNEINENLPSKEVTSPSASNSQDLETNVEDEKSEDNFILYDDNEINENLLFNELTSPNTSNSQDLETNVEDEKSEDDPITVTAGHFWNLLSQMKNYKQQELPQLLMTLKAVEDGLITIQQAISDIKNGENGVDAIYKRWCSEQKLIHFLRKGEFPPKDESKQDVPWKEEIANKAKGKNITNCFLHIHSYQNPCVCCRLSLVRAHKVFLKDELQKILKADIPFHIVVSYRQPYSNTAFKDFEEVKEIQGPLAINKESPLLSLYQINPSNRPN